MKPQEINPQETTRAEAFELWMNVPNPIVTFFKKIDVTNLVHISRKYKWKFRLMRTTLTISFQFHHTQMDGAHAGLLLKLLQRNINEIGRKYLIKR